MVWPLCFAPISPRIFLHMGNFLISKRAVMTLSAECKEFSDIHVLVADDDRDISSIIKFVLVNMGFVNIQQAKDGTQAMEYFNEPGNRIDLIVCDWMMPGISGLDVLKQVRAKRPDLPFLMLTAKSTVDNVSAARAAGVSSYIVKPFTPQDLKNKIKRLVDHARPSI